MSDRLSGRKRSAPDDEQQRKQQQIGGASSDLEKESPHGGEMVEEKEEGAEGEGGGHLPKKQRVEHSARVKKEPKKWKTTLKMKVAEWDSNTKTPGPALPRLVDVEKVPVASTSTQHRGGGIDKLLNRCRMLAVSHEAETRQMEQDRRATQQRMYTATFPTSNNAGNGGVAINNSGATSTTQGSYELTRGISDESYQGNVRRFLACPSDTPAVAAGAQQERRQEQEILAAAAVENGNRVGICFHGDTILHRPAVDDEEMERPERVSVTINHLNSMGLIDQCVRLPAVECEDDFLLSVHTAQHINYVDQCHFYATAYGKGVMDLGGDLYFSKDTPRAARLAAGSVVEATLQVVSGEIDRAFAIVRPPGHHCSGTRASGFCFFNSVAVAVRAAQNFKAVDAETRTAIAEKKREEDAKKTNKQIKKVLIVDWDVHHCDGTQEIFYDDPNVVVFSIHQYGARLGHTVKGHRPHPEMVEASAELERLNQREREKKRLKAERKKRREEERWNPTGSSSTKKQVGSASFQQLDVNDPHREHENHPPQADDDDLLAMLGSSSGSSASYSCSSSSGASSKKEEEKEEERQGQQGAIKSEPRSQEEEGVGEKNKEDQQHSQENKEGGGDDEEEEDAGEDEEEDDEEEDSDDAMDYFANVLGKDARDSGDSGEDDSYTSGSGETDSSQITDGSVNAKERGGEGAEHKYHGDQNGFPQENGDAAPVPPAQGSTSSAFRATVGMEKDWDPTTSAPFYPSTGHAQSTGTGPGLGRNVNFPWPTQGYGDLEYLYVLTEVLVPLATEFDPDLIIVSCGFDCAEKDLLGSMKVTPTGFYMMTQLMKSLCPKVVVAMEGGYNLTSVAKGAEAVLRGLLEDSLSDPVHSGVFHPNPTVSEDTRGTTFRPPNYCRMLLHQAHRQVIETQQLLAASGAWKCFGPPPPPGAPTMTRQVIRNELGEDTTLDAE